MNKDGQDRNVILNCVMKTAITMENVLMEAVSAI